MCHHKVYLLLVPNGNQPKLRQRVDKDLQILDKAIISEDGASWKSRRTVPSIETVLMETLR